MTCPNCNNDDWKLASLVYKSGLTHIDTSTTAVGIGFTEDGMDPGVGVGDTVGTHQTELSRLAAPPVGFQLTKTLLKTTVLFVLFGWWFSDEWFYLAACCGGVAFFSSLKENHEHDEALAAWEQTRICQCCGTFYRPVNDEG